MNSVIKALIIDDDKDICELLANYLTQYNFEVKVIHHSKDLANTLSSNNFDIVILDIMLPDQDGLSIYRNYFQNQDIPVVFLTALADTMDSVVGLELGADDYVKKPFEPRELLARLRTVLRRKRKEETVEDTAYSSVVKAYSFEDWTLNCIARHLVSPDGVIINLSGVEYRLLLILLERPNEVLSRDQLMDIIQGRSADPFDRRLDMQVSRLRSKLKDNGREAKLIKTIRGDGYIFASNVTKIL